MQTGVVFSQNLQDIAVPFKLFLMMQSADDMHLRAAIVDGLLASGDDLLVGHDVAFFATQIGSKRTECTSINAHICGIQMRIDVVIADVAIDSFPDEICQLPKIVDRNVGLVHHGGHGRGH